MQQWDQMYRAGFQMFPTRDDPCPARGPGLSHTSQTDSILCKDCGTPLRIAGSLKGPYQRVIAERDILSRVSRCSFGLCNEKAETMIEVEAPNGTTRAVPVCHLCKEDFRLGQREGKEFWVSVEGTLYVDVIS